ncbi:MAG: hypothetical protein HYX39_10450 [Bacteroidetes bacterium]|nr:hypothetical protein [Bacteroidota bacterium]
MFIAIIGGFKTSLLATNHEGVFHKSAVWYKTSISTQVVLVQASQSPFSNPLNGENSAKDKEKELEDGDDCDDDERDEALLLACPNNVISYQSIESNYRLPGSLSYFFLKKKVPLFLLFHSWKSHLI